MKTKNVERLSLVIDQDMYKLIEARAQADYLPVATWLKQFLHKNLLEKDNSMLNPENHEC